MNRIKERCDQLFVALVATALLAFAFIVLLKAGHFPEKFSDALAPVPVSEPPAIPDAELENVKQANAETNQAPRWMVETNYETGARGSLFASQSYILDSTGIPTKTIEGFTCVDSRTHERIPNRWFMDHGLSPLIANAALLDPDNDGFVNEEEWRHGTDPRSKDSHPPYDTKLFLKKIGRVPFRVAFTAFNGDISKPQTWVFQINTIDLNQPSKFLKIGDSIAATHFQLEKFRSTGVRNPQTDSIEEVLELTLVNTETKELANLALSKITDLGDPYVVFDYQWPPAAGEIRVKKLQNFGLRPETEKLYQVTDIQEAEAVIRRPDGSTRQVVHDPRQTAK